jgi:hypothetical protein
MSKTLINFLHYSELPTKNELENKISAFVYNFNFGAEFEKFDNLNQINFTEFKLNGQKAFVQIYRSPETNVLANLPDLKKELPNKDCDISFSLSSNSMHIISRERIELYASLVLHAPNKIFFTREILIQNISNSFKYNSLERHNKSKDNLINTLKSDKKRKKRNENVKIFIIWGILFLVTFFMKNGINSWTTPLLLFILIMTPSQMHSQRGKNSKNKDEILK